MFTVKDEAERIYQNNAKEVFTTKNSKEEAICDVNAGITFDFLNINKQTSADLFSEEYQVRYTMDKQSNEAHSMQSMKNKKDEIFIVTEGVYEKKSKEASPLNNVAKKGIRDDINTRRGLQNINKQTTTIPVSEEYRMRDSTNKHDAKETLSFNEP